MSDNGLIPIELKRRSYDELVDYAVQMRLQRDDLLEACKAALRFVVVLQNESSYGEPCGDWPEVAKLRADINKATVDDA